MKFTNLRHLTFADVDIGDKFFDSLKEDYPGFEQWYEKKSESHADAYVQYDSNNKLQGFLYVKMEEESIVRDVTPNIVANRILKVGTFKIDSHGTKMGEQFLKVIFDYAIDQAADVCYLTIYDKHESLIKLVSKYGFNEYGTKGNGKYLEKVYVKKMYTQTGDIFKDYPVVNSGGNKKYMLSIYPQYHSKMFPESILTNESRNIIKDISYTNSIQKVYVCSMKGVEELKKGDILVLYRTADDGRTAEYSAVATTVCTVIEMRLQDTFKNFEEFYDYTCKYTIFDRDDLYHWYKRGGLKVIRLVYNFPLRKRIVRHELIETLGIERDKYWGFFELTDEEFNSIVNCGQSEDYLAK